MPKPDKKLSASAAAAPGTALSLSLLLLLLSLLLPLLPLLLLCLPARHALIQLLYGSLSTDCVYGADTRAHTSMDLYIPAHSAHMQINPLRAGWWSGLVVVAATISIESLWKMSRLKTLWCNVKLILHLKCGKLKRKLWKLKWNFQASRRTELFTCPKLNKWAHTKKNSDLHLMGLAHMLQKKKVMESHNCSWCSPCPCPCCCHQKVAHTHTYTNRKTIANYGVVSGVLLVRFGCLPLPATPVDTLGQHQHNEHKKSEGQAGKTMRKITFALINFNNKNLNAFDTKQATVPKTRLTEI